MTQDIGSARSMQFSYIHMYSIPGKQFDNAGKKLKLDFYNFPFTATNYLGPGYPLFFYQVLCTGFFKTCFVKNNFFGLKIFIDKYIYKQLLSAH